MTTTIANCTIHLEHDNPDITVTPNIVDPDIPHQGRGFFYLVRRSDPLQNAPGTYDPAICLTEADDFNGPRRASSGDCP